MQAGVDRPPPDPALKCGVNVASQNALIRHGVIKVLWLTFRYVFVQKNARKVVPRALKQRWKYHSRVGDQAKACCVNISEEAVRKD